MRMGFTPAASMPPARVAMGAVQRCRGRNGDVAVGRRGVGKRNDMSRLWALVAVRAVVFLLFHNMAVRMFVLAYGHGILICLTSG